MRDQNGSRTDFLKNQETGSAYSNQLIDILTINSMLGQRLPRDTMGHYGKLSLCPLKLLQKLSRTLLS